MCVSLLDPLKCDWKSCSGELVQNLHRSTAVVPRVASLRVNRDYGEEVGRTEAASGSVEFEGVEFSEQFRRRSGVQVAERKPDGAHRDSSRRHQRLEGGEVAAFGQDVDQAD